MPERPDLRKIAGNIRDALAGCDRDTLLDILTFVVKEYVVEGPPPLLVNQAERLPDLEGLSFAELIAALQTRFDHPELSLFQVDGAQVMVRVSGVLQPLLAPRAQPGASAPSPQPAPEAAPRVQVVETDIVRRPPASGRSTVDEAVARGRADLAGLAREAVSEAARAEASAPPPSRGLSIRGRGAGGGMMPEPGATPPASRPAAAPPAQAGAEQRPAQAERPQASEPPGDEDGASTRFSLLELD